MGCCGAKPQQGQRHERPVSAAKPAAAAPGAATPQPSPARPTKTREEDRLNRRDMPKDPKQRKRSLAPDRRESVADERSSGAPSPTPHGGGGEEADPASELLPGASPVDDTDRANDQTLDCSDEEASVMELPDEPPAPANGGAAEDEEMREAVLAAYDEAHIGYDMIDGYDYDAAIKKLMELVKRREAGRLNLVALVGVSAMHGLGGDSWSRIAPQAESCSQLTHTERALAEEWLRKRHDAKRVTAAYGSPAALLALVELFRITGKQTDEDFVLQCVALPTPHPLALLRHSCDTHAAMKKEKSKGMNSYEQTEMEIEKRILIRNFEVLSRPNTRVAAKAGKFVWMSFYKGSDGFDKDLERAKLMLERLLHFEMGSSAELKQYLGKVSEKLKKGVGSDQRRRSHAPQRQGGMSPRQGGISPRGDRGGGVTPRGLGRRESVSSMQGTGRTSPSRRGSYTPRCTTPESPGLHKRSNSVVSEVSATVAFMNGVEVCAVKEVARPESPRSRGKVSHHDTDILDGDDDGAFAVCTTPRGTRRRVSERGHDIQEMIRRETVVRNGGAGRVSPSFG